MNILDNIPPQALWVLAGLVGFGVYWKKSSWPNRIFPIINIALGMIVYPVLELSLSDKPYQQFRHPIPVLIIAGAAIAIATVVLHRAIVAALKKAGIDFPDDEGPIVTPPTSTPTPPTSTPTKV